MKLARTLAALALSASLLLAACGESGGGDSDGSTYAPASEAGDGGASGDAVTIADFAFDPTPLEVAVGTEVTFTNDDSTTHTATSTEGPVDFDTGELPAGDAEQVTFDEAGTYEYRCEIHNSMTGEIEVK